MARSAPDSPAGERATERLASTQRQRASRQQAFLDTFRRTGNVAWSCRLVSGLDRATVYRWQEHDEQFAQAFRQAGLDATETLEEEAYRRAVEGNPYVRTAWWRGEKVGEDIKTEYSDTLLLALLKARSPERYRDRADVTVTQVVKTIAGLEASDVL